MKLLNFATTKKGISFIEILILLLLISLLSTFAIPRFLNRQSDTLKKDFIAQFIKLIENSVYQAITVKKIQQIYFDLNKKTISAKQQDLSIDTKNKHQKFRLLSENNSSTNIIIPESINIKNFFLNNEDEFGTGRTLQDAWFYIMPDGTSQSVIINFEYSDPDSLEIDQFALSVNPFYSQIYEYNTFKKP